MKTVLRWANFARSREPNGRGCIHSPFEAANSPCFEIYQMTERDPRYHDSIALPLDTDKIDLQPPRRVRG